MVLAVLNPAPPGRAAKRPSESATRSISASPMTAIIREPGRHRSWILHLWAGPWRHGPTGLPVLPADRPEEVSPAAGPGSRALAPLRLALLQERVHPLAGVGKLAGGGHHLDGVGVGLGLVQVDLRVQRLLADALALRGPAGHPLQHVLHGRVELHRR